MVKRRDDPKPPTPGLADLPRFRRALAKFMEGFDPHKGTDFGPIEVRIVVQEGRRGGEDARLDVTLSVPGVDGRGACWDLNYERCPFLELDEMVAFDLGIAHDRLIYALLLRAGWRGAEHPSGDEGVIR